MPTETRNYLGNFIVLAIEPRRRKQPLTQWTVQLVSNTGQCTRIAPSAHNVRDRPFEGFRLYVKTIPGVIRDQRFQLIL